MNKLIFITAFTLTVASLISVARASEISRNLPSYVIIHSEAHPNTARALNAVHHFEIKVPKSGLLSLSIAIPKGISIRDGIEVKDRSGQNIDAEVSMNDEKATLVFSQPVSNQKMLTINLKNVKTRGLDNIWNYRIYGTIVGMNQEIPLGTARIQTY
ncbi:DUF2808 domain-containing protein [Pleurocapsales cyanobacterium LEGE 06147]|nr:DUF2808 domain-containing protein [Pleurocapsales cyanobacterium LEGE 06147]